MGKKIKDEEVLNEDGIDVIADVIGAMVPWVKFILDWLDFKLQADQKPRLRT